MFKRMKNKYKVRLVAPLESKIRQFIMEECFTFDSIFQERGWPDLGI